MAYAPQAIQQLYNTIQSRIPAAQLGGILGDSQHSFGYHLSRAELPGSDYSVVLPLDQQGDADAASALDVTFGEGSPLMVACTNRLLAAAQAGDPRLRGVREFCGTTDGQHTHPYDLSDGQDGPLDSWDSSHLAHIHLSFYRAYANNPAVLAQIADVFTGNTSPDTSHARPITAQEDDMYTVYQVVIGEGRGQLWAVRAGSTPFWMSQQDFNNLNGYGMLTNPKQKDWKGTELIQLEWLRDTIKKGE